jgi:tetratricopeptide (TPR) repeat protein
MNLSVLMPRRRTLPLLGGLLILGGALFYGLEQASQAHYDLLQQAEALYEAQQYQEAITAYERVLAHAATPAMRLSAVLLGRVGSPARVALHLANCRYRLAEAALRHYQKAVRDPRITPRPALEAVQRLLTTAGQAYEEVPRTDPRTALAAQVNAGRVAAWQLILAAFDEQTPGRRSLRQQALQAIQRAAEAVDYGHSQQQHVSRQELMAAMLLLETLTAFSQEKPPPSLPAPPGDTVRNPLGDLLLRDTPELSQQERERFRQFFFALPIEAKDPWPLERGGSAGGKQSRFAH